eukprot:COSAG01_NODE_1367_length_10557_cov_13.156053_3_plen_208_part_00
MTRKTVSFHVSSATANANSDNTSFSIGLVPELDVGHTAEPTVYLHNLSFVNTFANVSKDLYDNATVSMTLDGETIEFDLEPGAYSLQDLELAIASNFTDAQMLALSDKMLSGDTDPYYADSEGFLDGQVSKCTRQLIISMSCTVKFTSTAPYASCTWQMHALRIEHLHRQWVGGITGGQKWRALRSEWGVHVFVWRAARGGARDGLR